MNCKEVGNTQKCSHCEVKAVIFDWAGTIVDYGCFAPLNVFVDVFKKKEIEITIDEARAPMGMLKKDHIRALLQIPRIRSLWCELFNRNPDENDIEELYADFEPMLLSILPDYTELVPEALELINKLSEKGIKIGSTTGYTAEMMKIVIRNAKEKGNSPDFVATSDEVPAGRPFPWMCYLNAIKLEVFPMDTIVKVGDTISDIKAFGN